MFEACGEVLDTCLRPLHYEILTSKALDLLKIPAWSVDLKKQAEDVREKMLCRQWRGKYFYVGKPYFKGAVKHWFLPQMLQMEPIVIPANVQSAINGAVEASRRKMIKKNPTVPDSVTEEVKFRGIIIERTVSDWFAANWPDLFLPASNRGRFQTVSCDDFRLRINGKTLNVDIFTKWTKKRAADLHIYVGITNDGQGIEWISTLTRNGYEKNLLPELGKSPVKTVVWLNCLASDLDYGVFQAVAPGNSQ